MTLNPYISFDVKFIFNGSPTLQLTAKNTLTAVEQPQLIGYFSVLQPDGITAVGSFSSPDVSWATNGKQVFELPLRTATDGKYMKGGYTIQFFARHPSYDDGSFSRTFTMDYEPVLLSITKTLDFYTPLISYNDNTDYSQTGWTASPVASLWQTFVGSRTATSLTPNHDPLIDGNYYASVYDSKYQKQVLYTLDAGTWLTILQTFNYSNRVDAYAPLSMAALMTYLDQLKKKTDGSCGNVRAQALYEKAASLYTLIRAKVCGRSTDGLKEKFEEFYQLTHDGVLLAYPKDGTIIPAYDFTSGCGGSGSGSEITYASIRPTPGVSFFTVGSIPAGKTIVSASRSGLAKGITNVPTTDSEQLQIVSTTITLPTGDQVADVNGLGVGELFILGYK